MLIFLFPLLSVVGAVLTALLSPLSFWWAPLLFLGYLVGFYLLFALFFVALCPFFQKKRPVERPNRFCRFLLVEVYRMALFFLRVRTRVSGMEKLPKSGTTFLVVSNHLSNYDHMVMLTYLRRFPIAFISKPENFTIPIIGRYLWNSGFLSIDRASARNALYTVNETARRIEGGGMCYGVFPEGTRSRTGKLLPFHSGVFLSAKKAKAPILVIRMTGTAEVNRRTPWRATPVKMEVLAYLDAAYTTSHTDAEISTYTHSLMLGGVPEGSAGETRTEGQD